MRRSSQGSAIPCDSRLELTHSDPNLLGAGWFSGVSSTRGAQDASDTAMQRVGTLFGR